MYGSRSGRILESAEEGGMTRNVRGYSRRLLRVEDVGALWRRYCLSSTGYLRGVMQIGEESGYLASLGATGEGRH